MKRSFRDRIEYLGLSYNKEITILILLNALIVAAIFALFIFIKEILILLMGLLILVGVNFFYINRYSSKEKILDKNRVDEMISLLPYFELFISNNNNVYNSLSMLLPYSSPFMEQAIKDLLSQIDSDKSVSPFIEFAGKFSNRVIETLMLSIYQMIDNGQSQNQFNEFNILFDGIVKEYHKGLIDEKNASIDKLSSWPLFAAGGIIISLTMSILTVIGDMINVL